LRLAWILLATAALVATLAAAGPAGAQALTLGPLTPISRPSPFKAGCGIDTPAIRDADVEPSIAADPRDRRRLVAVYEQDRLTTSNALSDVVGVSRDGGRRWRRVLVPGLSRCTNGSWEVDSNPRVDVGPDGVAYFVSDPSSEHGGAIVAVTSRDGGRTWSWPLELVRGEMYSQPVVTADPRRPRTAYVVWQRFTPHFEGTSLGIYFSGTKDGGRTWTPPTLVSLPAPSMVPMLGKPVLEPDGSLVEVFTVVHVDDLLVPNENRGSWEAVAVRSTDGGRRWSPPVKAVSFPAFGPHDPNSNEPLRALPFASTAGGPSGQIVVAVPDNRSDHDGRVEIVTSRDHGRSWSARRTVARVRAQVFSPSVAVDGHGATGVSWYDLRRSHLGARGIPTDHWFAYAKRPGSAWHQVHLAGPFDDHTAPYSPSLGETGRFLGDHQDIVAFRDGFGAIFTAARPMATLGPSSIFYRSLRPSHGPRKRL
jgi:BNR repeat-like domain